MNREKFLALVCVLFLTLCGYTSVFSGNDNYAENLYKFANDDSADSSQYENNDSADSNRYSEDNFATLNQAVINYFTDLDIIFPFENKQPTGEYISEGRVPNYLYENNLTIFRYYKYNRSCKCLYISGLKNEKVQQTINNTIEFYFQKLQKMSPAAIIGSEFDPALFNISYNLNKIEAETIDSCNNILSVYISRSFDYQCSYPINQDAPDDIKSFEKTVYLNFDLNTGEQINLADVFVNGFNYVDFINTKIFEKFFFDEIGYGYESSDYDLYPRGSFTGLTREPSFYITRHGLELIIDKNSPEFIIYDEENKGFFIPLSDIGNNLAVFDRFNSKGRSIYIDSNTSKMSLSPNDYWNIITGCKEKQMLLDNTIIEAGLVWEYPKGLPDSLINIIKKDSVLNNTIIVNLIPDEPLYQNTFYYEKYIFALKYGCYVDYNNTNTVKVYKINGKEIEEVELADIFVPGFDWQSALYNLIIKKYSQDEYPEVATMEDFRSLLNNKLEYFELDSDSITLNFTPGYNMYNYSPDDEADSIPFFSAHYSKIGCENLTIFHD